jgi:hypothetical protein
MITYIAGLSALNALLSISLCIFVLTRDEKHLANYGFATGMFSLALIEAGNAFLLLSPDPWILFWKRVSLSGEIFLPSAWLLFSLTFARANYADVLRRWRPVVIATLISSLFFLTWIGSDLMIYPSPDGREGIYQLGMIGRAFYIFFLLGMVLNLIHLENTFRASTGSKRWQIKYMLIGVGAIFSFKIYLASQALLYFQLDVKYIPPSSMVTLIASGIMLMFIVRHRLLGVDIFISRYVVYNSLTVLFVGGYLVFVGVIAQIIFWFGGPFDIFWSTLFSFLAILSLVVLLLSTTVRRKAALYINRHFYRHKHEFRDKWMETTDRIGTITSLDALQKNLFEMIRETLGARRIVLYFFDFESETFRRAESTLPFPVDSIHNDHPLILKIRDSNGPFFLDEDLQTPGEKGGQDASLSDIPPGYSIQEAAQPFLQKGLILCSPLTSGQEVIGFILMGEDVAGIRYSKDDFEILSAISAQTANQIRTIQLSKELLSAKEAETFHMVSTFFIHDLKNFVSTLSLLTQNAEEHLHDPLFQRDALRTLATTVGKMNSLISKLSLLSKRLEITPQPTNFAELIDQTLSALSDNVSSRVTVHVEKMPLIPVDGEQLQKVLLNLILNAFEASASDGVIKISVRRSDRMVVLSVTDQGRGMSQNFMDSALFKPFQSTKAHGFGVGLFQSKKIIETHGGRMEVDSTEGRGSEFRIILPLSP